MTDNVQEQNTEAPQTETPTQEAVDLTINDLAALRSIIDVASQRGAFKPNEMVAVGQTYTKLNNFLEAVAKQAEEAKKNG